MDRFFRTKLIFCPFHHKIWFPLLWRWPPFGSYDPFEKLWWPNLFRLHLSNCEMTCALLTSCWLSSVFEKQSSLHFYFGWLLNSHYVRALQLNSDPPKSCSFILLMITSCILSFSQKPTQLHRFFFFFMFALIYSNNSMCGRNTDFFSHQTSQIFRLESIF